MAGGEVEPGRVKNDPLSLAVVIATVAWHVTWSGKKGRQALCRHVANCKTAAQCGLPTSERRGGRRGGGEGGAKMRPQDQNSPPRAVSAR